MVPVPFSSLHLSPPPTPPHPPRTHAAAPAARWHCTEWCGRQALGGSEPYVGVTPSHTLHTFHTLGTVLKLVLHHQWPVSGSVHTRVFGFVCRLSGQRRRHVALGPHAARHAVGGNGQSCHRGFELSELALYGWARGVYLGCPPAVDHGCYVVGSWWPPGGGGQGAASTPRDGGGGVGGGRDGVSAGGGRFAAGAAPRVRSAGDALVSPRWRRASFCADGGAQACWLLCDAAMQMLRCFADAPLLCEACCHAN